MIFTVSVLCFLLLRVLAAVFFFLLLCKMYFYLMFWVISHTSSLSSGNHRNVTNLVFIPWWTLLLLLRCSQLDPIPLFCVTDGFSRHWQSHWQLLSSPNDTLFAPAAPRTTKKRHKVSFLTCQSLRSVRLPEENVSILVSGVKTALSLGLCCNSKDFADLWGFVVYAEGG